MAQIKSVLIVEDNTDMADIYRFALQEQGYTVQVAYSAFDALGILDEFECDCVVLDLMLPGSTADSFNKLRNHPKLLAAKLIVVSGYNNVADLAQAHGADAYLRKPFDLDELFRLLRQ